MKQLSRLAQKDEKGILKNIALMYLNQNYRDEEEAERTEESDKVGIWQRDAQGNTEGFTVDQSKLDEINFWAKNMSIAPKKGRNRVVLIGESAARGYFYDPIYNPALELNSILNNADAGQYEVVDLARTDLSYDMLINLIEESAVLEPDVLVVFAGNNWDIHKIWEKYNLEVSEVIREEGLNGLLRYSDAHLAANVEKMYKQLRAFTDKGIPVVIVIPEFNLNDWKDPEIAANWLMGGDCGRWNQLLKKTKAMMAAGEYENCIKLLESEEIKGYAGTELWYALAESYKHLGMVDQAEKIFIKIKDITMIYPKVSTPRAFSAVQKALKNEACKNDRIRYVDMHDVFSSEGGVIGREFFMDYCHLTSKGIKLLMQKVASSILSQDISTNIYNGLIVDKSTESHAHFLSAIHNAHWGQEEDIIKYHLETALREWPEIKETMKAFIDFQCRNLPVWMSKRAEGYIGIISEQEQRYLTENKGLLLDRKLINIIGDVLNDANLLKHIMEVRNSAYGIERGEVNLLDSDYYVNSLSQKEAQYNWPSIPAKLKRYGFLAAYNKNTGFAFTTGNPLGIHLYLVCQVNNGNKNPKKIKIFINEHEISSSEIVCGWNKLKVYISEKFVKEGMNDIRIEWPSLDADMRIQENKVIEEIEKGIIPELVPVYGEIHKFILTGE
ncbi:SGNH/GDSL hydrolase family protein [Kineothrix alysoides]|nr:SGNH/GDSL hydrolase family protein [Kineothrix alysoides]